MDSAQRKKKFLKRKSRDDCSKAASSSSADDEMDSSEDLQKEDGVQPPPKNQQNPKQQDQPKWPTTPLTPYNFFFMDKTSEIVRSNPGMSSEEIASLRPTEKMFKALDDKKKEKYVKLALEASEKYEKQVQEFKKTNPEPKSIKIPEKIEAPLAPTPFLKFCTRYSLMRKSISWCQNQFPTLADKDRLRWIDIALAEEASYLDNLEKFKTENPNLKLKMTPVLNDEEKLLVYMRCVFDSEFPSIPAKKDGTRTRMAQWIASWSALSDEDKKVYKERVIAMKHEFNMKLSAYLSELPFDNEEQETTNSRLDANKGIKRKKGPETNESSASSKKSSSSDDDQQEMSRASSSRSKSGKKMVPSATERKAIQSEEDSSDEGSSDEEEESSEPSTKSSSMAKQKIGVLLRRKPTVSPPKNSTAVAVSDDGMKLSTHHPKLPIGKRRQEIAKCLFDASRMKRKKTETGESSVTAKKSKSTSKNQIVSSSSEEEKSSTLLKIGNKKKATQLKGSGKKSSYIAIDTSDESDDSKDATQPKKLLISAPKPVESSKESSEESKSETEQPILPKKTVASTESNSSTSAKKAKFEIENLSAQLDTNGSDSSSTSSSDDESQETASSSSESVKSITPPETGRTAIQSEEDTSDEDDSDLSGEESSGSKESSGEETDESSALSKKLNDLDSSKKVDPSTLPIVEEVSPSSSSKEESGEDSSEESGSEPEQSKLLDTSDSMLQAANSSSIGKDSSLLVRPLWALHQKLFKNEPPKPPKTAAKWHAFEIRAVSNIPEETKKELWNELSEEKRKRLTFEHDRRLEEYEDKLQAFKNGLTKTELQAFKHIKRSQRVISDDESDSHSDES